MGNGGDKHLPGAVGGGEWNGTAFRSPTPTAPSLEKKIMLNRTSLATFPLLFLACAALPGCQSNSAAARPTSGEKARTTLCEALDAWQKGDSLEALRSRSAITVVERKWKEGLGLLEFE